jgi:hypothetical protein
MTRRKKSFENKIYKSKKIKKEINIYHRFFSQSTNLDQNIREKHSSIRSHSRLVFITDVYHNSLILAEDEKNQNKF